MRIAHFAVNRRVAVSMLALAIIVLGLFAIPRLPIALLPNFKMDVFAQIPALVFSRFVTR
jgi:multidrug efflux pump subunit AcrB